MTLRAVRLLSILLPNLTSLTLYAPCTRVLPPPRRYDSYLTLLLTLSLSSLIPLTTIFIEEYHSTPETQTDEAYNHPEDIEHFASHEKIEIQEAEREAKFQGISVEEALAQHEPPPEDPNAPAPESSSNESSNVVAAGGDVAQEPVAASKKIQVQREPSPDEVDPAIRFREAKAESEKHGEWGSGDSGYKFPSSPSEKMRYVLLLWRRHLVEIGYSMLTASWLPLV